MASSRNICERNGWKVGTKITNGDDVWEITAIGYKEVLVRSGSYESFFWNHMGKYGELRTCELHDNCNVVDANSKVKVEHKIPKPKEIDDGKRRIEFIWKP